MKKLLSILSGRLTFLVFSVVMVASLIAPARALASRELGLGGEDVGGSEGDPLDTNDFGSSHGTGGGSDLNDQIGSASLWNTLKLDQVKVMLIPEFVGGTLVLKVVFIGRSDAGLSRLGMEGTHAP